jgi:hypothetical protein
MQSLGGLLLLPLGIYGFVTEGIPGALTAIVMVLGIGSGVAIAFAESGTGVNVATRMEVFQRLGGAIAAAGVLAGGIYGGWRLGWAWAGGAYLVAVIVSFGAAALAKALK